MDPDIGSHFAPQLFIHIARVIHLADFKRQGDSKNDCLLGWWVDMDRNAHIVAAKQPVRFMS